MPYPCTGTKASSNSFNKGWEIKDNLVKLAYFKNLEWNFPSQSICNVCLEQTFLLSLNV